MIKAPLGSRINYCHHPWTLLSGEKPFQSHKNISIVRAYDIKFLVSSLMSPNPPPPPKKKSSLFSSCIKHQTLVQWTSNSPTFYIQKFFSHHPPLCSIHVKLFRQPPTPKSTTLDVVYVWRAYLEKKKRNYQQLVLLPFSLAIYSLLYSFSSLSTTLSHYSPLFHCFSWSPSPNNPLLSWALQKECSS